MYDEIIERLKKINQDEQAVNGMFTLLTEEIFDSLFQQLADMSSDEEMETYEQRMKESKSPEHFQMILKEIATKVYGDNNVEQKLKEDYDSLIDEIEQTVSQAKDLIDKYNQGDPQAKELIEKAQQLDTYKDLTQDQQ